MPRPWTHLYGYVHGGRDGPARRGAGDVARIYGPGLTQRAADQAETIVYELLCQLSRRVPRIYLDGGREIR